MGAVFQKELRTYFLTPLGYIFMGFFLLISGFFFALNNLFPASANYNIMLASLTSIFMFLVPILTMRLLAEESRQKTDQLLLTSPLTTVGIVLGKYFAAVTVFLISGHFEPARHDCLPGNLWRLYWLFLPGCFVYCCRAVRLRPNRKSGECRGYYF